ncbi:WD40-repeat-containing domain protein [Rhizoctonia solani]|nr:WD40-repeat-containing domain protein [Rhizoctonia solani]
MYSVLSFLNLMPHAQREPSKFKSDMIIHEGHRSYVTSVVFSPDGKLVASGSSDTTIRIWNAHSPCPKGRPLSGHTRGISSISHSSVGDMIASGAGDYTIHLWNVNAGRQIGRPLEGHNSTVNSVAFSPGANFVASASADKTVRLWDTQRRALACGPFIGHIDWVSSVGFSPDGIRVVSGSNDRTIRVWDIEHGATVIGPLKGHTNGVLSVSFSPDGSQVVSGSYDNTIRFWDARTGRVTGNPCEGHSDRVKSVAFSPNSTYVASGARDQTVRIWDVRTARQVNDSFKEHTGEVNSVVFSPCGTRIASGSHDSKVIIRNVLNNISDTECSPDVMLEDEDGLPKTGSTESIQVDQHMSIQEMFDLLLRHGCINLASRMDILQSGVLRSGGGFGNIWKGEMYDGAQVAIKVWRTPLIEQYGYKALKRSVREIYFWSRMKHENIHQLMGVIMFKGDSLGMVSEWMENGNLHEYMRKNSGVNKHQLCIQVACGLAYMHQHNVVHGDLKALNILMSLEGVAKLTDFGLSVMSATSLAFSETTSQTGSVRWVAPELLTEGATKTKESDVYALAMTMLEIFTGDAPYFQCQYDFQVMNKVLQGVLPPRPTDRLKDDGYGNRMWELLMTCWDRDQHARPSTQQVFELLLLLGLSVEG